MPWPPQGVQRARRRTARTAPRGPSRGVSMASTAYSEQVGQVAAAGRASGPGSLVRRGRATTRTRAATRSSDHVRRRPPGCRRRQRFRPRIAVDRAHAPSAGQPRASGRPVRRASPVRRLLECLAHGHLQFVEIEGGPVGATTHQVGADRQFGSLFGQDRPHPPPSRLRCTALPDLPVHGVGHLGPVPVRAFHEAAPSRDRCRPLPTALPQVGEGAARPDRAHTRAVRPFPAPVRSHRQALASLRPARPDDRPSGLGRHPLAETVCLGALAHVGLVGPFHPSTSFLALNRGHRCPERQGARHSGLGIRRTCYAETRPAL